VSVRCALCGLDIEPGRAEGGWASSGPGAWYHADPADCGPLLPPMPLPEPRLSGGRTLWPSDGDLGQPTTGEQRPWWRKLFGS
jgi:hypothetical protein